MFWKGNHQKLVDFRLAKDRSDRPEIIAMLKIFEAGTWYIETRMKQEMYSQASRMLGLEWSLRGPNLLTVAWKYQDSKKQLPHSWDSDPTESWFTKQFARVFML